MRLPEADHLRKVSEREEAEWVLDGARMQIVMKWKCSHCGNRSASKENFCSYCGARMTNAKGLDEGNKGDFYCAFGERREDSNTHNTDSTR